MVYGYHTNAVCIVLITSKAWLLVLKALTQSCFKKPLISLIIWKLQLHPEIGKTEIYIHFKLESFQQICLWQNNQKKLMQE